MNRRRRTRLARLSRRVEIDGRLIAPVPTEQHGKVGTYNSWGCRCQACTDANTCYSRSYRRYMRKAGAA